MISSSSYMLAYAFSDTACIGLVLSGLVYLHGHTGTDLKNVLSDPNRRLFITWYGRAIHGFDLSIWWLAVVVKKNLPAAQRRLMVPFVGLVTQ